MMLRPEAVLERWRGWYPTTRPLVEDSQPSRRQEIRHIPRRRRRGAPTVQPGRDSYPGARHELGSLDAMHWGGGSGDFTEPMCLFGGILGWSTGAIDPFLRAVADDKVRGLVVELEHGQVFGPYDGGADLFFSTNPARDAASGRYPAWLSNLASGL